MKKIMILLAVFTFSLSICAKTSQSKESAKSISKTDSKSGMSFETAVKVKTVEEEYQYLASKYPGSKVLGQALVYDDNGTPYDILTVQMSDGKTVKYYFDVTEVFKMYMEMYGL